MGTSRTLPCFILVSAGGEDGKRRGGEEENAAVDVDGVSARVGKYGTLNGSGVALSILTFLGDLARARAAGRFADGVSDGVIGGICLSTERGRGVSCTGVDIVDIGQDGGEWQVRGWMGRTDASKVQSRSSLRATKTFAHFQNAGGSRE